MRGIPRSERGGGNAPNLATTVNQWPTPMAGTPAQNGNSAAGNSDFSRRAETLARDLWTTPTAHDRTARGSGQTSGATGAKAGNRCLATDAMRWPTASARDWKGSSPARVTRANGKSRMDILDHAAEQGFTRPAPAITPPGLTLSRLRPIWHRLRASAIASHGRPVWRRLIRGARKRRLNPVFVEWLMGWPSGHALCACSATGFARWQRDMRGALSALPTASGPWIWQPPPEVEMWQQGSLDL